jgi:hypothetical protein
MASTPSFNWSTPDNTGLVKNGALDIRTLGDAIDTSMADLLGGTTGQVLAKASGTDMDFSWVTDATGIPATIFDAKGDIIAATAADTASRLAVGTNGQVLTADSTAATGLAWATAGGGYSPDMFSVTKNGDQTGLSSGVWTRVTSWTEQWDIGADFATPTWTCPATGYYTFSVVLRTYSSTTASANRQVIALYKNGSSNRILGSSIGATDVNLTGTATLSLVANDTIELYVSNDNASGVVEAGSTIWQGQFVRA